MPSDSTLLLIFLFVLAAGSGWAFARFTGRNNASAGHLRGDYFSGLSYILRDQPDKALELFSRLLEADEDTIEIHFALGSLFRRRGEVDRAIRIHQNIIARPNLLKEQRNEALHALGQDYLRAGLFDRAEAIYQDLAREDAQRDTALQELAGIYEQQKDWQQAIQARRQLGKLAPDDNPRVIAHYYCEIAAEAILRKDHAAARRALHGARDADRNCVRGLVMRADIARNDGETEKALRLYKKALAAAPWLALEVVPGLLVATGAADRTVLERSLATLAEENPDFDEMLGFTSLFAGVDAGPGSRDAMRRYLAANPTLGAALQTLGIDAAQLEDERLLDRVAATLRQLAKSIPPYRCTECGYASARLYWHCPGCKSWECMRAGTRLRLAFADAEQEAPAEVAVDNKT